MFFDAAVLDVGGEVAVAARAPVGSTAAAVPAAVAAAGAHATTETVRHEAVDDRVGAALHVRQQVRSQLPTHTHTHTHTQLSNKKLSYRRGTARCVVSVEILPIVTQQCKNYLYDKS